MRRFVRAKIFLVGGIFVLLAPAAHAGSNPSVIEAAKSEGKEKAVEYFKKLAAQDPVVQRGNTNRVQLTMAGEFPLIIAYAPTIQRETSKQHPIDWVPREPVPVQVNPMMLAAKAPHPNAGKLFIDFLLSKQGQKMLVGFRRIPVREDVDADPPRLCKGYKRIVEHPEDYKDFNTTVTLYQQILGIR